MVKKNIRTILHGLTTPFLIVDRQGAVIFANLAAVDQLGGPGAGAGAPDAFDAIMNKRKISVAIEAVFEKAEDRVATRIKHQGVVPRAYRVVATRLEPEKDAEDVRAVLSFEDISHIREAEQMRADFVANVSHELRSPLTTLYGFIETLQGPAAEDREAQARFLALMEGEARRMARLIDELLSLARLEGEEAEKPAEQADPTAILRQVAEMLAPQAETAQKTLVLDIAGILPVIPGDEDQLTQLFLNLIENALKYGRAGTEVTVRARLAEDPEGPAGRAIRVDVIDRGDGIPEKDIPRLTERFYRVDKGRSRAMGGTGLGLAIVKHILIRHRGRLEIESAPGQGSTFTAFLPVA